MPLHTHIVSDFGEHRYAQLGTELQPESNIAARCGVHSWAEPTSDAAASHFRWCRHQRAMLMSDWVPGSPHVCMYFNHKRCVLWF